MKALPLPDPTRSSLIKLAPAAIAIVLLLGLVGSMAIEPTRQLLEQRDRIQGMEAELAQVEKVNRRLEAHIDRLHDPDYIEQKARNHGLVLPGEVPIVVMPPSQSKQEAKKKRAGRVPVTPQPPGLIGGFLDFLGWR